MHNEHTDDTHVTKSTVNLTYCAPKITILGSAEELTKSIESGSKLDCARPGIAGKDDSCS